MPTTATSCELREINVEEFLYMDPDTGELVCMVLDGDGFRPYEAREIAIHMPDAPASNSIFSKAPALVMDWVHQSLDSFAQYEHSFPNSDASEWDDDTCSPSM